VKYVVPALKAGKNVFCEKPLAIDRPQMAEVLTAYEESGVSGSKPILMVGFNRRFSPLVVKLKQLLDARSEPKSFVMTVNAGAIPADHWVQDSVEGGGRIIGEACHFIDLLRFLAGAKISGVSGVQIGAAPGVTIRDDKASIMLQFEDGSFGTVHYLANGHKSFPKERLEVFCGTSIIQLNNFINLQGYGWPGFKKMKLSRQDKGNAACAAAFIAAIKSGSPSPIPAEEIFEVTAATFDVVDALSG
jgi:predicted dehydrogenase